MSDFAPAQTTFTGRRMLLIMLAFFATIIGVNMTMLHFATSTFGGLVVKNSYVASQHFEKTRDLARVQAIRAWDIALTSSASEPLTISVVAPEGEVIGDTITIAAQRPTHGREPVVMTMSATGNGVYRGPAPLNAGAWVLTIGTEDDQYRTVRVEVRK